MSNTTEKTYQRSNEPIVWGLFGAGGMLTAFITPVMILITGLLVPLGLMDAENFSYERVHGFATTWYGACIVFVLVVLPLWHTLHRIYHGLHDLGVSRGRGAQHVICYGFAFAATVFVATLLLQMC